MHSPMDSPPSLSLSPPTPSPATALQIHHHHPHLTGPLNPIKKKRTKAFTFKLQRPKTPKRPTRKPDPTAPKITMPCSECGKKFWSWKALYGHMRCHPDRSWRGINPPIEYRPLESSSEIIPMTPEDHEAASCLLLLAMGSYEQAVVEFGHTCGICLKVFPSGQALGGHKRCHWEKPESSTSGVGGAGVLDLNLPADPQLDDMQLVLRLGF